MTKSTTVNSATSAHTSSSSSKKDSQPLLVKIGDKWVNLDVWKRVHPGGGASLERFQGEDATEAFASLHSKEAFNMLEKMKNVESSVPASVVKGVTPPTPATIAFREFQAQLIKDGWFERTWAWDIFYVLSITVMSIIGTYISYSHPYIATILIGVAMQQAGWIGHDYVHGRGKFATVFGCAIGCLFNGFSGRWWSDKHNKHHVHTNQVGIDDDIQNDPILHLYIPEADKDHPLRPYQHMYYHLVYAGLYVSWRIQSIQWNMAHTNKIEVALISLNYIWLLCLPVKVAVMSIILAGWLVAEVVTATHQSEDMIDGPSFSFVDDQFNTTRDVEIDNFFVNWLWGGMQFQLEHHLFPTMPKYRYAALRPILKEFAKKAGVQYRTANLKEILIMNYETMRKFADTKKAY